MRNRHHEENTEDSTGFGDLMMNCLLAFLLVTAVFMITPSVKSSEAKVDQQLLSKLVASQKESLQRAAERNAQMAHDQSRQRKQTTAEMNAMLAAKVAAEEAAVAFESQFLTTLANGEQEILYLKNEIEGLNEAISKARAAKSLRLDFCIDCTGSMGDSIERLKLTIASVMRTLPQALTEVSIGVVAYRNHQLVDLPIEEVFPDSVDNSVSMNRVQNFVNRLASNGGAANIESAIRASMSRMSSFHGNPRECVVVIGDVSTDEVSGGDALIRNQLLNDLRAWSEQPQKQRRILALYTGVSGSNDEAFFEELGAVNEQSTFSTEESQLLELIIKAAFADGSPRS